MKSKFCSVAALVVMLAVWGAPLHAEDVDYDKYAPALKEPRQASQVEKSLLHFPVLPFAMVRYPTEKALNYLEHHHVPQKVAWGYDWLQNRGVTPKVGLMSLASLNGGADLDFVRLFQQKERFPDLAAESWVAYTRDVTFKTGGRLGLERIADTGFRTQVYFNYEDRPNEYYYGIGPTTSKGEGYVYTREESNLEYLFGYKPGVTYSADFKFGYRNTDISGGHDGGRGRHGEGLLGPQVPGIDGDELLLYKLDLQRDTRDQGGVSTRGSLSRAGFSYNQGVSGSDAGFFRYELEGAKYWTLGSERRVLALHALSENTSETGGDEVPFHQMPRLGGFGPFNYLTQTLRAYENNRFTDKNMLLFNLEYRYNIWEYRDWKTDAVVFTDLGQVYSKLSSFRFDRFRNSYGTGLRTSVANFVILSLEIAHSDEGTSYYAKSSTPF